jgi:hypothetical protein
MARIMTDTTNCYGFDNTAEAANKTDFDTNYKASCIQVDDLENQESTFIVRLTYAQFKVKIDGTNILWTDVKLEIATNHYDLYLLTNGPV